MNDLKDLYPQEAARHTFLQYRHYRRKWRRFTGRPVRKFRRAVKKFAKARHPQQYGRRRPGGGGFRRTYVTDQDIEAYLGQKGKGGRQGSGKGHGRKGNPRGKDGKDHEVPELRIRRTLCC